MHHPTGRYYGKLSGRHHAGVDRAVASGCLGKTVAGLLALFLIGIACNTLYLRAARVPPGLDDRGLIQVHAGLGNETPPPTPFRHPTDPPFELLPTSAATQTPVPAVTRTPTSTPTVTRTVTPTIATDPEGITPIDGNCPALYRIKISQSGVAHDLESGSYSRTNPIHCYAHMRDATRHGYTRAKD